MYCLFGMVKFGNLSKEKLFFFVSLTFISALNDSKSMLPKILESKNVLRPKNISRAQ